MACRQHVWFDFSVTAIHHKGRIFLDIYTLIQRMKLMSYSLMRWNCSEVFSPSAISILSSISNSHTLKIKSWSRFRVLAYPSISKHGLHAVCPETVNDIKKHHYSIHQAFSYISYRRLSLPSRTPYFPATVTQFPEGRLHCPPLALSTATWSHHLLYGSTKKVEPWSGQG